MFSFGLYVAKLPLKTLISPLNILHQLIFYILQMSMTLIYVCIFTQWWKMFTETPLFIERKILIAIELTNTHYKIKKK